MKKIDNPVVLMYHGILSPDFGVPPDREVGAELYDVLKKDFEGQMGFLKDGTWEISAYENKVPEGKRGVVLTFDDGETNNFHNAFPILSQHGFRAHFFVIVNRIGKKGYMNWEELKELRDADMLLGSHGLNHRILTELKEKEIEKELLDSKLILERNLKINIDDFSVPRGFYNQKVIAIARKVGYKRIFVSDSGKSGDDACVGRVAVKAGWSLERFKSALDGKAPLVESTAHSFKNTAKGILGSQCYNWLRTRLLKTSNRRGLSGKDENI